MAMNDVTQEQAFDFTRASTKWVWDNTGTLVEVPVDQPAYDHDPATGEPLGVLLEPEATNQWPNSDLTALSTSDAIVSPAPDGLFGDFSYRVAALNDASRPRVSATSVSHSSGTLKGVYIKPENINVFELTVYSFEVSTTYRFDLSSLTINALSSGNRISNAKIEALSHGWFFISFVVGPGTMGSYSAFRFRGHSKSNGDPIVEGDAFCAALPQVVPESGGVRGSPIPTAGAPVTRAADNMSRSLGAEFNPSAGTIVWEGVRGADASASDHAYFSIATSAYNRIGISGTGVCRTGAGGATFYAPAFGSIGQHSKVALSWDHSTQLGIAAINGQANKSDEAATGPVQSERLTVGATSIARSLSKYPVNNSSLRYYPYAMTEAELIELTTL